MKKFIPILLLCFGASGAFAQTAADGAITVTTDPAKAAAVEQHANQLKAQQNIQPPKTAAKSSKAKAKKKTSRAKQPTAMK